MDVEEMSNLGNDVSPAACDVFPDGLTSEDIEILLGEAAVFWALPSRATSALLDGSAVQRRERRVARREMGAVVRALPARSQVASVGAPSGEVA
jgi:hypothetical protein